jgi:hypothetical protein
MTRRAPAFAVTKSATRTIALLRPCTGTTAARIA